MTISKMTGAEALEILKSGGWWGLLFDPGNPEESEAMTNLFQALQVADKAIRTQGLDTEYPV